MRRGHIWRLDILSGCIGKSVGIRRWVSLGWLCISSHSTAAQSPNGLPVLFIPGNAGSSHQVRSIASSASRQYYSSPGQVSYSFSSRAISPLDIYAGAWDIPYLPYHLFLRWFSQSNSMKTCQHFTERLCSLKSSTRQKRLIISCHTIRHGLHWLSWAIPWAVLWELHFCLPSIYQRLLRCRHLLLCLQPDSTQK
jgi:hypothetical protein